MSLALHIIGYWLIFNVTAVPALTWWIFRNKRHERALRAHWRSAHPTTPWCLMPAHIAGSPKRSPIYH